MQPECAMHDLLATTMRIVTLLAMASLAAQQPSAAVAKEKGASYDA